MTTGKISEIIERDSDTEWAIAEYHHAAEVAACAAEALPEGSPAQLCELLRGVLATNLATSMALSAIMAQLDDLRESRHA